MYIKKFSKRKCHSFWVQGRNLTMIILQLLCFLGPRSTSDPRPPAEPTRPNNPLVPPPTMLLSLPSFIPIPIPIPVLIPVPYDKFYKDENPASASDTGFTSSLDQTSRRESWGPNSSGESGPGSSGSGPNSSSGSGRNSSSGSGPNSSSEETNEEISEDTEQRQRRRSLIMDKPSRTAER